MENKKISIEEANRTLVKAIIFTAITFTIFSVLATIDIMNTIKPHC